MNRTDEIEIVAIDGAFGAEIRGVELARPLDDATFAKIERAFAEHLLLCFPDQHLSEAQQVAFSRRFGELQVHVLQEYRHPQFPEIYVISNVDPATDRPIGRHPDPGTLVWHSDLSFQRRTASATILYGRETPMQGADTQYADMAAAYAALPDNLRRKVEGRRALHDLDYSRSRAGAARMTEDQRRAAPPVLHPMVRRHKVTGRESLYISHHISAIEGLPAAESRDLLAELMEHATRPRFVLSHRWRQHDLVMWDNRPTMHRATAFDTGAERRVMHRTVVLDSI
ncbi:MAG: TauD/TfdA family dioxygenase [Alphaproteobacteria bacterium]|nr:TauD/TfdA family dioxygenase [Alphaproteobacteria bacterium]